MSGFLLHLVDGRQVDIHAHDFYALDGQEHAYEAMLGVDEVISEVGNDLIVLDDGRVMRTDDTAWIECVRLDIGLDWRAEDAALIEAMG